MQFLEEQRFRLLRAGDEELLVTAAEMEDVGMGFKGGSTEVLVLLFPDE